MEQYSVLLRRQRYPGNLSNFIQDFEFLKVPGKWAGIISRTVDMKTSVFSLRVWFEDGKFTVVGEGNTIPLNWHDMHGCTIAVLRTMEFGDSAFVREFIKGLDVQDFEFYAIARGENDEFKPGHGVYGIVSMGNIEFEETGDIIELLRS